LTIEFKLDEQYEIYHSSEFFSSPIYFVSHPSPPLPTALRAAYSIDHVLAAPSYPLSPDILSRLPLLPKFLSAYPSLLIPVAFGQGESPPHRPHLDRTSAIDRQPSAAVGTARETTVPMATSPPPPPHPGPHPRLRSIPGWGLING
jgi:hypothetical protein